MYLYWTRFSIYKHSSLISLPLYSNFIETLKSNTMSYFCCYILSQISLKNWYEVNFMNLRFIFIDENFMIRVDVKLLYLWIKERMTFKNWTNSTVESPPIVLVSTIKLFDSFESKTFIRNILRISLFSLKFQITFVHWAITEMCKIDSYDFVLEEVL